MSYSDLSNIVDIDQINNLIKSGTEQVNDISQVLNTTTGPTGRSLSQTKINNLQQLFDDAKQTCKDAPGEIKTTENIITEHPKI